jgi:hypothetical protein
LLQFMALQRSESEMGGRQQPSSPLNKLEALPQDVEVEGCCPVICDLRVGILLLAGLGGEGEEEGCLLIDGAGRWQGSLACPGVDCTLD